MKVFSYKLILAACTVLIAFNVKAQQYSNFTQFADNLVPVNPTYSLVNGGGALNTLVRKQYAGIEGSPTTFMVNGYLPISSIGATAGIVVLSDELAVEKQTEINCLLSVVQIWQRRR